MDLVAFTMGIYVIISLSQGKIQIVLRRWAEQVMRGGGGHDDECYENKCSPKQNRKHDMAVYGVET